jgi:5-aminolevulinate synthase
LPPALAVGALASIRHLKESQVERARHEKRAATVKRRFAEAGLPVMPSASHIVPVMVGDPGLCKTACDELLHRHQIYVQPINYPSPIVSTSAFRSVSECTLMGYQYFSILSSCPKSIPTFARSPCSCTPA